MYQLTSINSSILELKTKHVSFNDMFYKQSQYFLAFHTDIIIMVSQYYQSYITQLSELYNTVIRIT